MTVYAALLRAINVGGTGKLPMTELTALCTGAGFKDVKTYIQSGNVVFRSALDEAKTTAKLAKALEAKMGKPVGVTVRTAEELEATLKKNPFKKAEPKRVIVLFLNEAPPKKSLEGLKTPGGEEVALGARELYINYPEGQGVSKLKLPFFKEGTGRNLNTIAKLIELARATE